MLVLVVWITAVRCFMASRTHVRGDVSTWSSHQFYVFTGFQWSSESSINWPPSSTSRSSKPSRTWRTTASWLLSPDAASFAPQTPTSSLFREHTLNLETWVSPAAGPRMWNSLPASLWQPDIEFGNLNVYWRHSCIARPSVLVTQCTAGSGKYLRYKYLRHTNSILHVVSTLHCEP